MPPCHYPCWFLKPSYHFIATLFEQHYLSPPNPGGAVSFLSNGKEEQVGQGLVNGQDRLGSTELENH